MTALLDQALAALAPVPHSFTVAETKIAHSFAGALIRDRTLDEITWSIVLRYAHHRARWDALHVSAAASHSIPKDDHFLTGTEQSMAYHANACTRIEDELLGTPKSRAKANAAQTTFLDTLTIPTTATGGDNVTSLNPFQPLKKRQ